MGKLSEYIALFPRGYKNIPNIIDGIVTNAKIELGMISERELNIIIKRRIICNTCPYNSKNAQKEEGYVISGEKMPPYKSDRDDEHCILCGCVISLKTASIDEVCGVHNYNLRFGKNEKLRW